MYFWKHNMDKLRNSEEVDGRKERSHGNWLFPLSIEQVQAAVQQPHKLQRWETKIALWTTDLIFT